MGGKYPWFELNQTFVIGRWARGIGREEIHDQEEQKGLTDETSAMASPTTTSKKKRKKDKMKLPAFKQACAPSTTELCHDIDVCSFYISPPIFIVFNLAYWITFLNYDALILS